MPEAITSRLKICLSLCPSDIAFGRVYLDVCGIDQSTSLPSGLAQMVLIFPSHIYVETPTSDITIAQGKADFQTACNG